MAGQDVPDAAVRLHRRVEGVDRGAGQAERGVHALPLEDGDGGIDGAHTRHGRLLFSRSGRCRRSGSRPDSRSTPRSSAEWSRPPSPQARSEAISWATTAPSGITTPASRAALVTMPRSLWCSSTRKPGLERSGEHPLALLVEDLAAGQPAAEDLQRGLRVDAVRLQEDHRLGQQLDVAGDDELVGRLDGLPGAAGSDVHHRRADGVEHRPGGVEVAGLPADHDRQRAGDRAGLAAGDRGVEHPQLPRPRLRGELGGDVGPDAGEVDDQGALARGGEDSAVAGEHLLHVRGVRHHHRHDVGLAGGVGGGLRTPAAALDEPGDACPGCG